MTNLQVKGGAGGRDGGGGGRMSIIYNKNHYIGELLSLGGTASGGEIGAAGTVYLRDIGANPTATKLLIYNQKGNGVSLNVYLINH